MITLPWMVGMRYLEMNRQGILDPRNYLIRERKDVLVMITVRLYI